MGGSPRARARAGADGRRRRRRPARVPARILEEILLRTHAGKRVYGDPAKVATEDLVATLERIRDVGSRAVAELVPELATILPPTAVREHAAAPDEICSGYRYSRRHRRRGAVSSCSRSSRRSPRIDVWSLQQEAEAVAAAYERSWQGALTGTTHISVVDGEGRCAALSSTLGSGSGVFRGGAQLNNMLGELDVIGAGERTPGERLPSMMTPTVVLDSGQPRLVIGSAGSVRLAGAIAQVAWRVLGGTPVADAIEAPRLHVEGSTLHLEGGWADDVVAELPPKWDVVRWDGLNLYFGGVQAVERAADGTLAAAGDPGEAGRAWSFVVITFRRAAPGDAAALVALAEQVAQEKEGWILTTDAWRSVAEERRYLKAARRHPDAAVFVAEDDGGSSRASPLPATRIRRAAHVADLGLMVDAALQAAGIGKRLLEEAVGWARVSGVLKLELHVFPWNEPAIALYEAFGFEQEGFRKGHYSRDEEYLDAILMAYRA